mgnify:CR=1 FL=1
MGTRLNPYLSFRDSAREAMEFYHSVFGGKLTTNTFAEFHASEDPAEQDKIMHSLLETDGGLVIMAADTPNSMELTPGSNFAVSLSGEDEAEQQPTREGRLRPFLEQRDQQVGRPGPDQDVERVHRVDVVEGQPQRSGDRRQHGERLGEGPAAQPPGGEPDEQDGGAPRDRRQQAHGEQRIAHEAGRQGEQGDRQRRMIDEAPGQAAGRRQVVQLVAEDAVARIGRQVQRQLGERQPEEHEHLGDGEAAF